MITLRTEREIAILREANQIVADVLVEMAELVRPGITTAALDEAGERLIRGRGAGPAFLGYRGYPRATCISVDEVIVHGVPGARRIEEGEIVSIDVGVLYKGYYGDAAISVPCGRLDPGRQRLLEVADCALARGIVAARDGNRVTDVSRAIQETCEAAGFSVVRAFVGHGIGTAMHEELQIPNFVTGKGGPVLREGMVMALEPMVNMGAHEVRVLEDGWTAVTADGLPSAHFEHSIVVRKHGGEILSATMRRAWGQDIGA